MRVDRLIEELKKHPPEANARAYEGEVTGIIIECDGEFLDCIDAHESDDDSKQFREHWRMRSES